VDERVDGYQVWTKVWTGERCGNEATLEE
jgi:hypothetical protein